MLVRLQIGQKTNTEVLVGVLKFRFHLYIVVVNKSMNVAYVASQDVNHIFNTMISGVEEDGAAGL